jgi:hypothetical protein
MKRIVLFDKDSTLADTRSRRHLSPYNDPTKTWVDYSMGCAMDAPITGPVRLIEMLYFADYEVHIISAANEECRDECIKWLNNHLIPYDVLRLKREDDPADNTTYKLAYIAQLQAEGRKISLMVEDWPEIATAVERITGVPVLCLNPYQLMPLHTEGAPAQPSGTP